MEEDKKLENIQEILESLEESILHSEIIQDNKYLFMFNDQLYRVRMPSQREKSEANLAQNKLYVSLIQENLKLPEDQRHKTRSQLKEILSSAGIVNIAELENKRNELHKELKTLYYELAEKLSHDINSINDYKDKIIKVKEDFKNISVEIANHLMVSIEDRKEKVYIEYITYLCSEKLIRNADGEKWEKIWNTLEDYQKESTGLDDKSAFGTITLLVTINQ